LAKFSEISPPPPILNFMKIYNISPDYYSYYQLSHVNDREHTAHTHQLRIRIPLRLKPNSSKLTSAQYLQHTFTHKHSVYMTHTDKDSDVSLL